MNLTQILQREYKDMIKYGDRYDIDSKYMFYVERNYIDISYSDNANSIVSVYTKDTYATDDEIAKLVREFERDAEMTTTLQKVIKDLKKELRGVQFDEIDADMTILNEFVYDGCHKIYLMENEKVKNNFYDIGYENDDFRSLDELADTYKNSCGLEFIQLVTNFNDEITNDNFISVIPQQ